MSACHNEKIDIAALILNIVKVSYWQFPFNHHWAGTCQVVHLHEKEEQIQRILHTLAKCLLSDMHSERYLQENAYTCTNSADIIWNTSHLWIKFLF